MKSDQTTVTIKLTRDEVNDIIILCAFQNSHNWRELCEKLIDQLAKADEKFSGEK